MAPCNRYKIYADSAERCPSKYHFVHNVAESNRSKVCLIYTLARVVTIKYCLHLHLNNPNTRYEWGESVGKSGVRGKWAWNRAIKPRAISVKEPGQSTIKHGVHHAVCAQLSGF